MTLSLKTFGKQYKINERGERLWMKTNVFAVESSFQKGVKYVGTVNIVN